MIKAKKSGMVNNILHLHRTYFLSLISTPVWRVGVSLDGEAEVWWKLQQTSCSDRETCCSLRHFTQNRPAHGFPQWVLCPPETTGTYIIPYMQVFIFTLYTNNLYYNLAQYMMLVSLILKCLVGLLCGDTLSVWDGHPGATYTADPVVVSTGHLPPRLCIEGSRPDESQVSFKILVFV